jgi:hypothetical protein
MFLADLRGLCFSLICAALRFLSALICERFLFTPDGSFDVVGLFIQHLPVAAFCGADAFEEAEGF